MTRWSVEHDAANSIIVNIWQTEDLGQNVTERDVFLMALNEQGIMGSHVAK
jgi:hypothetical protein